MIEVFEINQNQWAYRVGAVYQEWHPDFEGFVPMDKTEAERCAALVEARMAE